MIIDDRPFNGLYEGEDVEVEVKYYMEKLMEYTNGRPYTPVTRKYERIKIPDGFDRSIKSDRFRQLPRDKQKAINEFWEEQDARMREGHEGMPGLMYGYFNFHKFNGNKAKRPSFRRNDWELFWLISACIYGDNEHFQGYYRWGIDEIGRRRSGKTEKIAWTVIHVMRTERNCIIIVTSKTEKDAQNVIIGQKIKYAYDNLPLPIKPSEKKTNSGEIHLAVDEKDEDGNRMITGRNTKVMAFPPKSTSAEGNTLWGWIHDEQGKTNNLGALFSNTVEALNDEEGLDRDGFVYLTGVAGDFDMHGTDAITIWEGASTHKLVRWLTPGWVGLSTDEFGNEDIEDGVRRILTKRSEIFHHPKMSEEDKKAELRRMQQKYPLTVEEAMLIGGDSGRFDRKAINERLKVLQPDPPKIITGDIYWSVKGVISEFRPNSFGKFHLLEMPKPGAKYIIGVDAYGMKQVDSGSDGAAWIFKLKAPLSPREIGHLTDQLNEAKTTAERLAIHLEMGYMFVGYYSGRNPDPTVFAEDIAAIAKWLHRYSRLPQNERVKILCETAPSVILNHLLKFYKDITMNAPIIPGQTPSQKYLTERYGIDLKEYWREASLGELSHYFANYIDMIYFIELLTKAKTYNSEIPAKKWDIIDGGAVTMVAVTDPRTKFWAEKTRKKENKPKRLFNFRRR